MVAAEDELNYWRLAAMVLKIEWLPSFFSMHLLAVGTLTAACTKILLTRKIASWPSRPKLKATLVPNSTRLVPVV